MTQYPEFTLAAIQAAPVFFDRDASTDKACRLIEEAAEKGATLAAFSETWLPGYPIFAWGSMRDPELFWQAAADYVANAVEIPSPTTERLCAAAKQAGIDVVIGIVELDGNTHGTVYCTLLFVGREGNILGRHRKLKPTHRERTVWGEGDATGLVTYDRPYGRISGLNCWEHNMMLPGYVLAAQGTQIHVAAWPGGEHESTPGLNQIWSSRQLLLSRAFASQSASYVVLVGGLGGPDSMPDRYKVLAPFTHTGDSYIIDPRGEVIAGPADGETILVAKGSLEAVLAAKSATDIGGHYSRPDIFQLHVNGKPLERVVTAGARVASSDAEATTAKAEPQPTPMLKVAETPEPV